MATTVRWSDDDVEDSGGPRKASAVSRGFELLFELMERDLRLDEVAALLGCSDRQARRYIDDINAAAPDGALVDRVNGKYRFRTPREFIELADGAYDENVMAAIVSTPLGGLVRTRGLPERVLGRIRGLVDSGRGERPDNELAALFKALVEGRYIDFDYTSDREKKRHRAVPVRLFLDPVQVYLVAYDEAYGHLICLAATKMAGIRAVPAGTASMSSGGLKELRDYTLGAWGKMIRHDSRSVAQAAFVAAPAVAPYFRRNRLRLDQAMEELEDGSLRVGLRVHNPTEFVRFMLRFGTAVKIEGDAEVLAEARAFLERMRDFYG